MRSAVVLASLLLLNVALSMQPVMQRRALAEKRRKALANPMITTALDIYVNTPDPNYRYVLFNNVSMTPTPPNWDGQIIKMYSQMWLTPDDWNRGDPSTSDAIWWHWMTMITPHKLNPDHADVGVMWITGGSNNNGPPTDSISEDNSLLASLCVDMGVVGVALYQVPNQPIYFTDEVPPKGRSEDAFIAWTWKHFLDYPGNPETLTTETEWLARLPMTKAAKAAMDTLQTLKPSIEHFIISGASKRGWTTWTIGLTDARVIAIIPIVLDALHMIPSLHHMYRAYGGWTFAFEDYYDVNLTAHLDDPEFEWLCQVEDPYYYLPDPTRFLMPKLVINAGMDEFLQNDNDFYWWDQMPVGEGKHRLICANAEHSEITGIPNIEHEISAWGNAFLNGQQWPDFNWTIDPTNGTITVKNNPTRGIPINVTMFYSHNAQRYGRRDWRIIAGYPTQVPQNTLYSHQTLQETYKGSNTWVGYQANPKEGWMAFMLELYFDGPAPFWDPTRKTQYRMTTQMSIVPKNVWFTYDCYSTGCYGTLV